MTSIDGVEFEECFQQRQVITIQNIEVSFIAQHHLIQNKTSSGRLQDLADAEKLSQIEDDDQH